MTNRIARELMHAIAKDDSVLFEKILVEAPDNAFTKEYPRHKVAEVCIDFACDMKSIFMGFADRLENKLAKSSDERKRVVIYNPFMNISDDMYGFDRILEGKNEKENNR